MVSQLTWEHLCALKRAEINAKIPKDWVLGPEIIHKAKSARRISGPFIEGLLECSVRDITEKNSVELVNDLHNGSLTAYEVTEAFCRRAAAAHQIGNCLHEIFFDTALSRAKELDKYYIEHKRPWGPLHGLPISLKDVFHVKGIDTFMGYAGWIGGQGGRADGKKDKESEIVRILYQLGAILYCKTSCPQTLAVGEVHNNIIGYTWNPENQELSCGGSSGGEAALQALRGSSIGFGTDQGGSVRAPASFCGLYSIKPSYGRLPDRNISNNCPGQAAVPAVVGIISTSLISIKLLMSAISSEEPWKRDPAVMELPWRETVKAEPTSKTSGQRIFCFAVMGSDGVVSPHPPIARGIRIVVNALEKAGHRVITWNPPSHSESNLLHARVVFSDKGADMVEQCALSKEPLIKEVQRFIPADHLPEPISLPSFEVLNLQKRDFQNRYLDYWHSSMEETGTGRPVDGVILPVAPTAAVINDKYMYYGYTNVANLLDYTCVAFPVTKADQELDVKQHDYVPLNALDQANWEAYDPEKYHGAPVGLQIMGQRLEEEKVLSLAESAVHAIHAAGQS